MSILTDRLFEKIVAAESDQVSLNVKDTGNYNACSQLVGSKYGITPNSWSSYANIKCPTATDIAGITLGQAKGFINWYGNKLRIWEIADQDFAELAFNSFYANPLGAANVLQQVLVTRGYKIAVDGIMGSKTLAAANVECAKDKLGMYNEYRQAWLSWLRTRGGYSTFGSGWENRMNTYFPPLSPLDPAATAPVADAPTSYETELWKRRLAGILKSPADAAWIVGALLLLCLAVYAIHKYFPRKLVVLR